MQIIKPSFEFFSLGDPVQMLKNLEKAGRVCYKSEGLITETSYLTFLKKLMSMFHESVLEHEKVTVKIICDRGVTHELVRHRMASYSQESTRYCNYSKDKFGNELTFIDPCFWEKDSEQYKLWADQMQQIENTYNKMVEAGATAQEARSILPNSLKTEIVVTMNFREWRHFFKLRAAKASHPQMREVALMMLAEFKAHFPVLFDDLIFDDEINL